MVSNARSDIDQNKVQELVRELLITLGEDPSREGLQETPRRVAKFWKEFLNYDPGKIETTFESIQNGQLVVISGMRVWSLCEHHLLPFWCDVSIGYVTQGKVLGLSKFARIAHKFAHELQVQERLVAEISKEVSELCATPDVAVTATGVHTCMTMRGIKTDGLMTSSAMLGKFEYNLSLRAEFLQTVAMNKRLA